MSALPRELFLYAAKAACASSNLAKLFLTMTKQALPNLPLHPLPRPNQLLKEQQQEQQKQAEIHLNELHYPLAKSKHQLPSNTTRKIIKIINIFLPFKCYHFFT